MLLSRFVLQTIVLSCGAYALLHTAFTCAVGYARFEVSGWADALRVKHGPELYRVFFCAVCYVKERPVKSHFRLPPPPGSNLKFAFYYAVRDPTTIVLNFLK